MAKIKGITVKLYTKAQTGTDPFDRPVYKEAVVEVENVLVTPINSADMVNELNLTGKTVAYELSIPKGDQHDWTDARVDFFGEKFTTIGYPEEMIEKLVPLDWNKKVKVERYG